MMDISEMTVAAKASTRFEKAVEAFLVEANYSRAAHTVVDLLRNENAKSVYDELKRNDAVQHLAIEVEKELGCTANLMFRCDSPLHNSLQTLMDIYYDMIDGVYYNDTATEKV